VSQSSSDPDAELEPKLETESCSIIDHFASSGGSNWKGWIDINLDADNKIRTPSSLSCQPGVASSGGSIAAALNIFGDYIPVSITPSSEGGVLAIDSTDGRLSSVCTLTAGGSGTPARIDGQIVCDGDKAAAWDFSLVVENETDIHRIVPASVVPFVAAFRTSYRLEKQRQEAAKHSWGSDVPTRTWEGKLFHKLFVREAYRLKKLPSNMYDPERGFVSRGKSTGDPPCAKPPEPLHLPWSIVEEQNLARMVEKRFHSVEAVIEAMEGRAAAKQNRPHLKDQPIKDKELAMVMCRSTADVYRAWTSLVQRLRLISDSVRLNDEQIKKLEKLGGKGAAGTFKAGRSMAWATDDSKVQVAEEVFRQQPLLGPAGPHARQLPWMQWAQDFLQAANILAERELIEGRVPFAVRAARGG
jgi:hypothetical protein